MSDELGEKNEQTLARISCRDAGPAWTTEDERSRTPLCDIAGIENDPAFQSSDYVLDRRNRYFLYNKGHLRGFWLNRSDITFLRQFRQPKSVTFETGERWRLYSVPATIDDRVVEVMVAVFEYAPWTIGKNSVGDDVDEQLRDEAQKIIKQLRQVQIRSRADAWQIVDAKTQIVRAWSGDVPALYPDQLNSTPWMLHVQAGQVWLQRRAATESLEAVSVASIGSPYVFVLLGLAAFALGSLASYPIAQRFVRTGVAQPTSLDDALQTGESDIVEFKQEIKERQQFLKDVAAFANTRGGTLFIGIVDGTKEIVGVDGAKPDRRDGFDRGLRDSIRQNIQPSPDVVIDYPQTNDRFVARVFVPAGREPHSFEGRYYVREGSQSRFVTNGEIARL
ncbi:MAG: putative transcriptional regulator [Gammaproteobacteria bacterium]|nr:putative transcriptional regulator [Gammaproteobacteria bacterium]